MHATRMPSPSARDRLTFSAFHARSSQLPALASHTTVPVAARRQLRSVLAAAMIGERSAVARMVGGRVERSSQSVRSIESALRGTCARPDLTALAVSVADEASDGLRPYRCAVHVDGWVVTDAAASHDGDSSGAVATDAPWLVTVDAMCAHLAIQPLPDQRTFADLIVAEWADRLISACLAGCGPQTAHAAYRLFPSPDNGAPLTSAQFRSIEGPALARAAFERLPDPDEIAELLPAIAPARVRHIIAAALAACATHRPSGIYPIKLA